MKAVVVYESMYGNTHLVADAIAGGIRDITGDEVVVAPVDQADAELLVGTPSSSSSAARPMSTACRVRAPGTRRSRPTEQEGSDLTLDPDAEGPGLREWFDALGDLATVARGVRHPARRDRPSFTGRASKGIGKRLRKHGCALVVAPESFLVTKQNHLVDDEAHHAHDWGAWVARACGVEVGTPSR